VLIIWFLLAEAQDTTGLVVAVALVDFVQQLQQQAVAVL
jgi:hypothetical protein